MVPLIVLSDLLSQWPPLSLTSSFFFFLAPHPYKGFDAPITNIAKIQSLLLASFWQVILLVTFSCCRSCYLKRFPSSRKTKMEGSYSLYSQGSSGWTSMKNEEFQEADVWGNFKESKDSDSGMKRQASVITKRLPTATRMIPKSNNRNCISQESRHSAPLNIPDWSKIYGKGSDPNWDRLRWEDEDGCVVPPHEWIGRSQMSSFSVCEGAGRTLKGRDLSRVRNAVLIKTGFLESNSNF